MGHGDVGRSCSAPIVTRSLDGYVAPARSALFFDPINHSLTKGLRSAVLWPGSLMLHANYLARSTGVASGDIFPRYLEGICYCFCPPQRARMLTNPGCGLVHIGGTCDRDSLRKSWNQQLVLRAIDVECELQSWLSAPTYQIPVMLILTGVENNRKNLASVSNQFATIPEEVIALVAKSLDAHNVSMITFVSKEINVASKCASCRIPKKQTGLRLWSIVMSIECLAWARSLDSWPGGWDKRICEKATRGGHLDVLKWARDQEEPCPWSEATCSAAAQGGHLDVLKWARDQEEPCPWDEETCSAAARHGHLDVLKWARGQEILILMNLKGFMGCLKKAQLFSEIDYKFSSELTTRP